MEIKGITPDSQILLEEYVGYALTEAHEMLESMIDAGYADLRERAEECISDGWNLTGIKEVRAVKRIGCAHGQVSRAMFDLPYIYHITISSDLTDGRHNKALYNTLLHEIFHVMANQIAGSDQGHRGLWAKMADYYNTRWREPYAMWILPKYEEESIFTPEEIEARAKRRMQKKYAIHCPVCGAVWRYKVRAKAVQNPGMYTCGRCHVKLEPGEC